MSYERHEDMVGPSRARPEWWRLGAGIVLSFAVLWIGSSIVVSIVFSLIGIEQGRLMLDSVSSGGTPAGTYLVLFLVSLIGLGPLILARPLHGRRAITLFGPFGRAVLDFALSLRALAILFFVLFLLPGGEQPEQAMPFGHWLTFLPLTVLAIFVQVTAEEVAFRGYLQSELAARVRSPLVWMIAPSVVFGLVHMSPETGADAGIIAFSAFLFAVSAADLTARTGTLGAAIALHFSNNLLAIALVAFDGPHSSLALYAYSYGVEELSTGDYIVQLAVTGVSWLTVRVALRV